MYLVVKKSVSLKMTIGESGYSARHIGESCDMCGYVISAADAFFVTCKKSSSRSRTLYTLFHPTHTCVE